MLRNSRRHLKHNDPGQGRGTGYYPNIPPKFAFSALSRCISGCENGSVDGGVCSYKYLTPVQYPSVRKSHPVRTSVYCVSHAVSLAAPHIFRTRSCVSMSSVVCLSVTRRFLSSHLASWQDRVGTCWCERRIRRANAQCRPPFLVFLRVSGYAELCISSSSPQAQRLTCVYSCPCAARERHASLFMLSISHHSSFIMTRL